MISEIITEMHIDMNDGMGARDDVVSDDRIMFKYLVVISTSIYEISRWYFVKLTIGISF